MQVAPGGQDRGGAHQITARSRADVLAVQRAQDRRDLVVCGQQAVALGQGGEDGDVGDVRLQAAQRDGRFGQDAVYERGQGLARRSGFLAGLRHRRQKIDALLRGRGLADGMQAAGDQGLFDLEHLCGDGGDRIFHRARVIGGGEIERLGFFADRAGQRRPFGESGLGGRPPALDRALQVEQALIQPGLGHRRGQVADQRRSGASLGQRAFRRIVGGVEIDIRQIADQPLRPTVGGEAHLLARHELQRPVGAEMQHRVRAEVLLEIAIEGGEGMGRREAPLEQEPHRVALVAEARLEPDEHLAELGSEHEDRRAVAEHLARSGAPLTFDLGQMSFAADMVFGRECARWTLASVAETGRIAFYEAQAKIFGASPGRQRRSRRPSATSAC